MATYRCLSCGGVYVDPQPPGVRAFHACPLDRVDAGGRRVPIDDPRDENIVQEAPGGPVHLRLTGKGREKLSDTDLLTGLRPEDVPALLARPAIGPSPLPEEAPDPRQGTIMPAGPNQ